MNGAPYSNKGSYAGVEYVDGRTVMCINNNYILQKNADFKTRPAYEPGLDGLLKPSRCSSRSFTNARSRGRW